MSAIRLWDWDTHAPRLVDQGPCEAVPLRGYSLRGTSVVVTSERAQARETQRRYVEANRDAVNARKRVR